MKEFLKNNWGWILVILLILGFVVYQQFELKEKYNLIDYQDSLRKIDSTKYSKLALEFQTQKQFNEDLKKNNESLAKQLETEKEQVRLYTSLYLKYKDQHFVRVDTVKVPFEVHNDTIFVPLGQDTVGFDEQNSIFRVYGQTHLYPYKGYWMNFTGKPFKVDVVVSEDRNGIWKTYVDTQNPDLELLDIRTRFIKEQNTLGFFDNISGITSLNFTNKDVFIDLGFLYKKFGVKGVLGYDYQDYSISKGNLKFGGGIIYKPF